MACSDMHYICVVLLFSVNLRARSAAVISPTATVSANPGNIIDYLKTYGYVTEDEINRSDGISKGLTRFQKFMGIVSDGHLTDVTKKIIKLPRCGQRDISLGKRKQQSLMKTVLKRKEVRYTIRTWSKWMPRTIQNQTITKMLRMWADDIAVKCLWSENEPDVIIIFKPDKVQTKDIDKPYAVFTNVGYADNRFTIYFYSNAAQSVKALSRASAHSIGHVFGHKHTNLYSIMSPIFRQNIERIVSDDCPDISIDSAFLIASNGVTYMSKESSVWWVKEGYTLHSPENSSTIWKGVPLKIDEGFLWPKNWNTYVFQGTQYYRFKMGSTHVDDGYPVSIRDGWPGVPDYIDAAFFEIDTEDKYHTYFAKGNKIYKYDDENNRVHDGFPKPLIAVFPGVPTNIDTAFTYYYDKSLYFFKGIHYWIWDAEIRHAKGPYQISVDWKNLCIDQ